MTKPPLVRLHGVQNKDIAERTVFVLTFAIGAAGIIAFKWLNVSPVLVASFSAAMIILYVAFAMFIGRIQIEPEMVGDNCYYLGFLFTLTSLSFTLSELAATGSDVDARTAMIGKVISGFGVALSSTIVGVFLRVVLMQIRPDVVARDREMHIELHESVRELRRQLSTSVVTMKQFTTESIQHTQERDKRIGESLEGASTGIGEATRSMFADIARSVREANLEASRTTTKILTEQVSATLTEKLSSLGDGASRQLEESVERLTHSVAKISVANESAAELLTTKFEALDEKLTAISNRMGEIDTEIEKVSNAINSDEISASVANLSTKVVDGADGLENSVQRLQAAVEKGALHFEKTMEALDKLAEQPKGWRRILGRRKG